MSIRRSVGVRRAATMLRALCTALPLAMLLLTGAHGASAAVLTFGQAVNRALQVNPDAAAAAARLRAAAAGVREARSAAGPRLSAELGAARSDNPLTVFGYRLAQRGATFRDFGLAEFAGPASVDSAPAALNDPGFANNWSTGIALTIPLYAGGANSARIRAARAGAQAADASERLTQSALTFAVLRTYDGVHAARDLARAARKAREAAAAHLASARLRFREGATIRSDVLTAEAQLAAAQAAEHAAQATASNALDAFRVTLGAHEENSIPGTPVDFPMPPGTLDVLQDEARAHNAQLAALRRTLEAREAAIAAARGTHWPHVDLTVRHDWNATTPALAGSSTTVMGTLRWDLFTSGAQQGAVARAIAERDEAAADLRKAEDVLRLEVAQRLRAVGTAEASMRADRAAATQAQEAARLLALRYAHGLATLDELLNAQARLDAARADFVRARYDAVFARGALRLSIDTLPASAAIPLGAPDRRERGR